MNTAILRPLPRTLLIAGLALVGTLSSFAVTTTTAQAAERASYSVTLAKPLDAPQREIVDGAMWRCDGSTCSAPANGERAATLCGKVARTFGEVARFEGPRGELDEAALAKCNAGALNR